MNFFELDKNKIILQIQDEYPGLWELAVDTNNFLTEFQKSLDANRVRLHEVVGVPLHIRCVTTFQALLLLASKGMVSQSQIMLRALIEALFILVAISNDNDFALEYLRHEEHQRKNVLNKSKRYKESVDKEDPRIKKANKVLEEIRCNIDENKIKTLSTENISRIAGLHSWYDTVYAVTSTSVHVSVRTLEHNLEVNGSTGEIESFVNEPNVNGIELPIATAINSMHIATDAICDILARDYNKENMELKKRYEEYCAARTK